MPRILTSAPNTLDIRDRISDSTIRLYYRMPTTEEHSAFQNEGVQRKGRKVVTRFPQTRVKYGLKILTGFRAGDFCVPGDGGDPKPIASDPDHPDYLPEWKAMVEKLAGDIVQVLAAHVFESPAAVVDDGGADDGGEEIEPD